MEFQNEFFNKAELAKWLRVSPQTVDRLRKSDGFPQPIRIGRSLRWLIIDVTQWATGR